MNLAQNICAREGALLQNPTVPSESSTIGASVGQENILAIQNFILSIRPTGL
ncbi:hypothetical protein BRCON_0259 [Candidatus Sumerlaea chitinivorans]|uniref:Uncharacterized protein n=1 Tax=Sumerlaea chitinivorans TaxID=2250252 RepID=A0A2Z4Y298_SUMC1|nr:hypothetical protein BRCON_0259 [Candidatus Sumerlaea chitinivorans]